MTDPRVPLKNPVLAAVLAFLLPGLGHLYQGRFFKSALFAICILGTWTYGMALGDWRVVSYSAMNTSDLGTKDSAKKRAIAFYAQVGIGLPVLPSIWQSRRYFDKDNDFVRALDTSMTKVAFVGVARLTKDGETIESPVEGVIDLTPTKLRLENGEFGTESIDAVEGEFTGRNTETGKPMTLVLGGDLRMGRPIEASPDRFLETRILEKNADDLFVVGALKGTIPRRFTDWYQVPVHSVIQNDLIRQHGAFFDLGAVFTWIAGFLNIFAIWDAFEGPAYGYGDEKRKGNTRGGGTPAKSDDAPDGNTADTVTSSPAESV